MDLHEHLQGIAAEFALLRANGALHNFAAASAESIAHALDQAIAAVAPADDDQAEADEGDQAEGDQADK